jgi:multimeric flavodoxin WrbA
LRLIASPDGAAGSLTIHADAAIHAGLFDGAESASLSLDVARKAYVHLVRGRIVVNGHLLRAGDAIIMGSPTYMGSVSWQFKKFADASSKPWFSQAWKDKIFAGFTNSATMNGDKLSTLHYLFTLAMQHGGIWVGRGMMPANNKAAQRNDLNYVGSFCGAMATSPADCSADEMLPGDLETARRFGQRVAGLTVRCRG